MSDEVVTVDLGEQLVRDYREGVSLREMQRRYHISRERIRAMLRASGVRLKKVDQDVYMPTPEQIKEAAAEIRRNW